MHFQRALARTGLGLFVGCGASRHDAATLTDAGSAGATVRMTPDGAAVNAGSPSGPCNLNPWGVPSRSPISSNSAESAPMLSWDGLELYFPSDRPGGTGAYDLYVARRTSPSDPFGAPVELREVNTTYNEDTPYLTLDKLTLYFASNRPGGVGGIDIWRARRDQVNQPFGRVENVGELNTSSMDAFPFISFDQRTLFLVSGRDTNIANVGHVYVADVAGDHFSNIRALSEVNSPFAESSPWLERDGLTFYFSSTRAGMNLSSWNIFVAHRPDTASPFGNIARVSFDTSYVDLDTTITADDCTLFFTSTRPGTIGDTDIWQVSR